MDFIMGLPTTTQQHNLIMVVVDKFSKASHFIPIKSTHKASDIAQIFMKEIYPLHGFPKATILDQDTKFNLKLWNSLFQGLDTWLNFSTDYHL